jgi:DNA transformation protein and related proteins
MPSRDSGFATYIQDELLQNIDGVSLRRMFDGHGVYRHGVCIGLVHEGILYLKVDQQTKSLFEQEGSRPFTYIGRNRKKIALSFWSTPTSVADDPTDIVSWVIAAYEAALRAKKKKFQNNT